MEIIKKRRSIRRFLSKKIPFEILNQILEAGTLAPSPKNRQPWKFVVIQTTAEKEKFINDLKTGIEKLIKKKPERSDIYMSIETIHILEQVPVIVLVCYNNNLTLIHDDGVDWQMQAKDIEVVDIQSIGAAVQNMLLEATELGIGSLWCGDILYAYPYISYYSAYPIISAVCFGYTNISPNMPCRKAISDVCNFI